MNFDSDPVHISNRDFSDEYAYVGRYDVPTSIRITRYNAGQLESEDVPSSTSSFRDLLRPGAVNWIEVNGLTDTATIARLVAEFGLHSLDLRDILTPVHVVKIETEAERIFMILNSCYFDNEGAVHGEHVCIAAQKNVILTFTERARQDSIFKNAGKTLQHNTMNVRSGGTGLLLGFLLNTLFSVQIATATRLEQLLEGIEHILLGDGHHHKGVSSKIQRCRHAHLILQKNFRPLKKQFAVMQKTPNAIIDESLKPVFDDLADQLAYINQTTNNGKEILESLVDLYISQNDFRANMIMKHLTVVATLFIPVTFLAGVWGMNFRLMPELDWEYGYAAAWAVLLATGLGTWLIMKRKRWF